MDQVREYNRRDDVVRLRQTDGGPPDPGPSQDTDGLQVTPTNC